MLGVVTPSLAAYQDFLMNNLTRIPSVAHIQSSFAPFCNGQPRRWLSRSAELGDEAGDRLSRVRLGRPSPVSRRVKFRRPMQSHRD